MSFKYVGAFTLDIFWPLVAHSGKTLPHIWPLPSCSYSEKRIRQTFDHGLNAPLYTWHRQNCCLAPYSQIGSSAAVLSKQMKYLTFSSSHIWIQACMYSFTPTQRLHFTPLWPHLDLPRQGESHSSLFMVTNLPLWSDFWVSRHLSRKK